ncbi:MAG: hypothetical protein Q9220_003382 [cf. Caloplaca sp. 1 TL-2023]
MATSTKDTATPTQPLSPSPSQSIKSPQSSTVAGSHPRRDSKDLKHDIRPSLHSFPSTQRNRIRVPWRGKTCIVSLPPPVERRDDKLIHEQRGNEWEASGSNPSRSSTTDWNTFAPEVQTRQSFPDPEQIRAEQADRPFRVNLPDRAGWDLHVEKLREARLRALGVDSGSGKRGARILQQDLPPSREPTSHNSSIPPTPSLVSPNPIDSPRFTRSNQTLPLQIENPLSPLTSPDFGTLSRLSSRQSAHHTFAPLHAGPDPLVLFQDKSAKSFISEPAMESEQSGVETNLRLHQYAADMHQPAPSYHRKDALRTLEQQADGADDAHGHTLHGSTKYEHSEDLRNALPKHETKHSQDVRPISVSDGSDGVQRLAESVIHQNKPNSAENGLNALAPEFKVGTTGLASTSTVAGATMRPTAPAFTPGQNSRPFPSSKEFSFSPVGPSFNQSHFQAPNRVYSRVSSLNGISDIHRPDRRSRAVPILKPRDTWSTSDPSSEVQEDESGRITQAEGRQKRIRRSSTSSGHDTRFTLADRARGVTNGGYPNPSPLSPSEVNEDTRESHGSVALPSTAEAVSQLRNLVDQLSTSDESSSQSQDAEEPVPYRSDYSRHNTTEVVAFNDGLHHSSSLGSMAFPIPPNFTDVKQTGVTDEITAENRFAAKHGEDTSSSQPSRASRQKKTLSEVKRGNSMSPSKSSTSISGDAELGERDFDTSRSTSGNIHGLALNLSKPLTNGGKAGHKIDSAAKQHDFGNASAGLMYPIKYREAQDVDHPKVVEGHPRHSTSEVESSGVKARDPSQKRNPSKAYEYLPQTDSDSVDSSVVRAIAENPRFSPSYRPSQTYDAAQSPSQCWGSADSAAIKEFNRVSSSIGNAPRRKKRKSTHGRVSGVLENIVEERLAPLHQSLAAIQSSLLEFSSRFPGQADLRRPLDQGDNSDADDEDEVRSPRQRTKSPIRDRKIDRLIAMVSEMAPAPSAGISASELKTMSERMQELSASMRDTRPATTEVKTVVEEAIAKKMRGRSAPISSSHHSAAAEKNQLQIDGLESMLKIAEGRADDELKARRATEDALADNQRLLRLALLDAAEQRESAEETERSLAAFHEERHDMLRREASLEGVRDSLERTATERGEKNVALEGTLEEYRLSSAQWRMEIESAKGEHNILRTTVAALKSELEDGIQGRQALRARFDLLQEDMALASQNVAKDQSTWRIKEEELAARYKTLTANYERETRKCQSMEQKISVMSEDMQSDNNKHCQLVAQHESESHNQKELAKLDMDRMQKIVDEDRTAATLKFDAYRTEMESKVTRLISQVAKADETVLKERAMFERLLQEAAVSKTTVLQERQELHEMTTKVLHEKHEQLRQSTTQEKQHLERQLQDRLAMADQKMQHYQDHIVHLQDRVEVARSAAQAAVQSTHTSSGGSHQDRVSSSGPSAAQPEKVSPQALRESILVLQEQLQDRESQIERLEQQLSEVDTNTPARLKAQATEISWLRELLGVRIDDLQDLIITLDQPIDDGEAIKNAAIRLKANLQMELQEKERVHGGDWPSMPPISSISSLAASPRALPLAAAAAWGNWRKGWNAPNPPAFATAHARKVDTAQRSSPSSQSVSSGLLTPPHSTSRLARRSDGIAGLGSRGVGQKRPPLSTPSHHPTRSTPSPSPPVTPSLTRRTNYDMDAADAGAEEIQEETEDQPFGPNMATFPGL